MSEMTARCAHCGEEQSFLNAHKRGCLATLGRPIIRLGETEVVVKYAEDAVTAQRVIDGIKEWQNMPPEEKAAAVRASVPSPPAKLVESARDFQAATTGAQHVGRAHLAQNIVEGVLGLVGDPLYRDDEKTEELESFVVELLEEHDRTRDETIARLRRGR